MAVKWLHYLLLTLNPWVCMCGWGEEGRRRTCVWSVRVCWSFRSNSDLSLDGDSRPGWLPLFISTTVQVQVPIVKLRYLVFIFIPVFVMNMLDVLRCSTCGLFSAPAWTLWTTGLWILVKQPPKTTPNAWTSIRILLLSPPQRVAGGGAPTTVPYTDWCEPLTWRDQWDTTCVAPRSLREWKWHRNNNDMANVKLMRF